MENLTKGSKVTVLERGRITGRTKVWIEKPGIVLDETQNFIVVKHKNYVETYMLKDFAAGCIRLKA